MLGKSVDLGGRRIIKKKTKLCSYVQRVHNSYEVICQRDAPLCNDYLNIEMETIYYLTYTAEQ